MSQRHVLKFVAVRWRKHHKLKGVKTSANIGVMTERAGEAAASSLPSACINTSAWQEESVRKGPTAGRSAGLRLTATLKVKNKVLQRDVTFWNQTDKTAKTSPLWCKDVLSICSQLQVSPPINLCLCGETGAELCYAKDPELDALVAPLLPGSFIYTRDKPWQTSRHSVLLIIVTPFLLHFMKQVRQFAISIKRLIFIKYKKKLNSTK